jgi:hypothetical protein
VFPAHCYEYFGGCVDAPGTVFCCVHGRKSVRQREVLRRTRTHTHSHSVRSTFICVTEGGLMHRSLFLSSPLVLILFPFLSLHRCCSVVRRWLVFIYIFFCGLLSTPTYYLCGCICIYVFGETDQPHLLKYLPTENSPFFVCVVVVPVVAGQLHFASVPSLFFFEFPFFVWRRCFEGAICAEGRGRKGERTGRQYTRAERVDSSSSLYLAFFFAFVLKLS